MSGSVWRAARAASVTPRPGSGKRAVSAGDNGRRIVALLAVAVSFCGDLRLRGGAAGILHWPRRTSGSATVFPKRFLILLAAAWVLLFLHNFPFMPPAAGFDAPDHLAYVSYIQDHQRLALGPGGLGNVSTAALLHDVARSFWAWAHCEVFQPSGMMLLRVLSLAIGAANLALVFHRSAADFSRRLEEAAGRPGFGRVFAGANLSAALHDQ